MTNASIWLWGRQIGAVALPDGERYASFEYSPDFAESGIELSPLMMPLDRAVHRFPGLPTPAFHGCPACSPTRFLTNTAMR